jgi:di/tricarboxylate transporter
MPSPQAITLLVLAAVVAAMIWDKLRSDVVALTGAAVLLMTGVVQPRDVQGAFASPAIVTLASLFVIAYAMELSGLLDATIRGLVRLCRRIGRAGLWIVIALAGSASAFLNNTPIVVLSAPVVREAAKSLKLSPKGFLMPLSYAAVLGGCCTLIGTSTNLLVNDMAAVAGQPRFGIFEITPVGIAVAISGGLYLLFFSGRLIRNGGPDAEPVENPGQGRTEPGLAAVQLGSASAFAMHRAFRPLKAFASLLIFVTVVALAALNVAPIAACAFAGAVLLILLRVITADEAYNGLRPDVLMLIAGMVVLGIALDVSGVAEVATATLIANLDQLSPLLALVIVYGATLFATELLSNATVAVLFTPVAVSLAEALQVSPRPFLVAVMIAGSAAFATPFGYQTNVLVYQMGGYNYLDFVKVGLPLNFITWIAAIVAIQAYFPF